jgi:hypothetical protein
LVSVLLDWLVLFVSVSTETESFTVCGFWVVVSLDSLLFSFLVASFCVYILFCDSTFLDCGELSESEFAFFHL